ncbi:hypothetical protein BLOT_008161 [Blomia tropicalis]|nr:hypothetical protein BLOT_008161 [Blomia tropicalis]
MNNEMNEFGTPFNIATTMTQLIGQLTIIYANIALPKLEFATEKRVNLRIYSQCLIYYKLLFDNI